MIRTQLKGALSRMAMVDPSVNVPKSTTMTSFMDITAWHNSAKAGGYCFIITRIHPSVIPTSSIGDDWLLSRGRSYEGGCPHR